MVNYDSVNLNVVSKHKYISKNLFVLLYVVLLTIHALI